MSIFIGPPGNSILAIHRNYSPREFVQDPNKSYYCGRWIYFGDLTIMTKINPADILNLYHSGTLIGWNGLLFHRRIDNIMKLFEVLVS